MNRLARSVTLASRSYALLMKDTELMVLPVLAGIVIAIIVATFVLATYAGGANFGQWNPDLYFPLFALYVMLNAVATFFQCAVVAGAAERMRGGSPTLGSALGAAGRRLVAILIWSCFAATIGVVLRAIQDRVGFVGRLVVALLGAGWTLATFFVVPVLVLEDVYIGDVLGRSVELMKETWGEALSGGVTLGFASFIAWLTLFVASALVAQLSYAAAFVVFTVGAILLIIFFSALHGVWMATLYGYATDRTVPSGFDKWLLKEAFVDKD